MPDVTADGIKEQRPLKRIATNKKCSSSQALLAKLDSGSGITGREFQKLFTKCDTCGCIMTRRVFVAHNCDVIDLTGDTDLE